MDEQQYKATYDSINPHRCVFEKAINSRVCNCSKSQRFNLADREGVACESTHGLERCNHLLTKLRKNARFVLQRIDVNQTLGHAEEIKVQNGGLLGLQAVVDIATDSKVEDIDMMITMAEEKFNNLENFPYSQIMQIITTYNFRKHRKKSKPKFKE